jgi:hypothetical protein
MENSVICVTTVFIPSKAKRRFGGRVTNKLHFLHDGFLLGLVLETDVSGNGFFRNVVPHSL